eukprot:CAMPEP_0172417334 /NCGR_PEP_ID=MMETSP1064-20121228/3860_1 /TAXON_ID=202472 /ORGANISM="Aulacoseira subarctica , Strain CCAP 1002/5" /LENGTH=277 /DNA_ID=CAMNT_0013155609 /DNA_START=178 /DNA_END=1011 /DNA_ORIENTATION=-
MGSAIDAADSGLYRTAAQKWAIAGSSLTFISTLVIVAMHMVPRYSIYIVGTKLEGFILIFLIASWSAIVGVCSDTTSGLAVDSTGRVQNGNLYYFSWAGFVCSVVLFVSYLRSVYSIDMAGEIRSRSARLTLWAAFMASSLIVMGSSARMFDNQCRQVESYLPTYCRITKFAVSLGCLGTVLSLGIIALKIATSMAPFTCEVVTCILLFLMYTFGVAYITSEGAPGGPLNNLYYFTWFSFLLLFGIGGNCFEQYQAAKAMREGRPSAPAPRDAEIGM